MNSLRTLICVFVGLSRACEVPPPGPEIDWSKILGKGWYDVVNSGSPIDEIYKCYNIVFEKAIPGGFADTMTTRNRNGDIERVDARDIKLSDGYYTVEYKGNTGIPHDIYENIKKTNMAVQERQDEFMSKLAYYTDHENYFLILGCRPDDRMEFWHFAPNRNPTAEDILRVTNILGQIGGGWSELQLSLDECFEE